MVHRPSTLSKRKVFRKTKKKKISNILQDRGGAKKTKGFSNEKKQTKSDNSEQDKGTVEPKKVSAVTNGRLTLPNVTAGIFMRGKTSSFCTRTEVHLNPLNEARINEKLHDILKLARNDNHSKCKYKSVNIEKNHEFDMSRLLPAVRLEKEVSPIFLKSSPEISITTPKDRNDPGITMGFTSIEIKGDGEMKNANHRNDIQAVTETSSYEKSYVHTYLQFREFLEYLDEVSYLKRTCTTDYVADLKNLLKQKSRVSTQQKLSLYTSTTVQSGKYIQEVPERKNKTVIKVHTQEDNTLRKKHRPNIANNFQKNKSFKSGKKKSPERIKILGRDCGEISNTGMDVDTNMCEAKGSVHEITAKFSFPSPVIFLQQSQEASENNLNKRVPLNAISFLEQTLNKSNETENYHQQKFATALFGHEPKHSPWYRSENAWLEDESTSPFHLGTDDNTHEMLSVQKDTRTRTTQCSSSKSSLHSDATGHDSFQYSLACTRNSPYSVDSGHLPRYHIPEDMPSRTTATHTQEFSPYDILETRLLNYRKYHIPNKMEISTSTGNRIKKSNCIELARCKNTFTMDRFQILDNVDSTSVNTPHTFDSKQDLIWCRRRMF